MKKVAAILLIGILGFNWCGYRLLDAYLESRADRQLEARLDSQNYDESQLLLIKVPATHLSYYNASRQFERVDGQIEIAAVQYKYVKLRLFNDSLELLCIPNHTAMRLRSAKNAFFSFVNNLQPDGQNKKNGAHSGPFKNFAPEKYTIQTHFHIDGPLLIPIHHCTTYCALFSSYYCPTAGHPPEWI